MAIFQLLWNSVRSQHLYVAIAHSVKFHKYISPGAYRNFSERLSGLIWALYARGLYTEHLAKFEVLSITNFMCKKNCTDFKQNHFITHVFQSTCVIIILTIF